MPEPDELRPSDHQPNAPHPSEDQPATTTPASKRPWRAVPEQPSWARAERAGWTLPALQRGHWWSRRRPRALLAGLALAAVLTVVVCGVVLARQALLARNALTRATDQVNALETAVRAGDMPAADAALTRLQPLTARAAAATHGGLWPLAAKVPVIGADAHALTTATGAIDTLAHDVAPPLLDVAGRAERGAFSSPTGLDLAFIRDAAATLTQAGKTVHTVDGHLSAVNRHRLHGPVVNAYSQLAFSVRELRDKLDNTSQFAAAAPALLGATGPRQYLIVAQNNAELRATGGIPGAFALVRVDQGNVTLVRQASAADVGPFTTPVTALSASDMQLFTTRLGQYVQDTTLTPDFPTSAALMAAMWHRTQGQPVDGVIATDPIALSYVLGATGPVQVDGIAISQANAVQTLLSTAYARWGEHSDGFFAAVAATVFTGAFSPHADPSVIWTAAVRATREHRLLAWSAHPAEQRLFASTPVGGSFGVHGPGADAVGVFLNDATGGKLGFYQGIDVALTESVCHATERSDTFQVMLTSSLPAASVGDLVPYVLGPAGPGPGVQRVQVLLYPPTGGQVWKIQVGKAPAAAHNAPGSARAAAWLPVDIAPGSSTTVTFTTTTPAARTSTGVDVWSTPTTTSTGLRVFDVVGCGA